MPAQTDSRTFQRSANKLIAALPAAEFRGLYERLTTRPYAAHQVLYRRGDSIRHVYFPQGGTSSVLAASTLAQGPEIGVIGNEGVIGANVFFGEATSACDVVVSIGGGAVDVLGVEHFNNAMLQHGAFHNLVVRYSQAVVGQMSQLSACNGGHPPDARACRWLLTAGDRVGRDTFEMSCELLARRLGVPQPSIVRIIAGLSRSGSIEYSRGTVRITNRELLTRHACSCYGAINTMFSRLLPELWTSKPL